MGIQLAPSTFSRLLHCLLSKECEHLADHKQKMASQGGEGRPVASMRAQAIPKPQPNQVKMKATVNNTVWVGLLKLTHKNSVHIPSHHLDVSEALSDCARISHCGELDATIPSALSAPRRLFLEQHCIAKCGP